jgi:hypothetical protein
MLGMTPIHEDMLYYPKDRNCFTVDAILLEKRKNEEGKEVIDVNSLLRKTKLGKKKILP